MSRIKTYEEHHAEVIRDAKRSLTLKQFYMQGMPAAFHEEALLRMEADKKALRDGFDKRNAAETAVDAAWERNNGS